MPGRFSMTRRGSPKVPGLFSTSSRLSSIFETSRFGARVVTTVS